MIVVRIWGGLGNQMFQYALGYTVSRNNNDTLKLDTSFFKDNHNSRQTERTLDLFKLPISSKDEIQYGSELGFIIKMLKNPYINYAIRKLLPISFSVGKYTYVKEHHLEYIPWLEQEKRKYIYYDGYWHSEKYFRIYRKDLIKQFTFSNIRIENEYANLCDNHIDAETVAIHIRRGDYISQKNPNARGVDYYRNAIEKIKTLTHTPRFCFFSDDLGWVAENFYDVDNSILANKNRVLSDIEEFQLMAKCKHQIISNSSYSWWAAWLNQNQEKIVVVPKEWKNKKDMMLEEWIKI